MLFPLIFIIIFKNRDGTTDVTRTMHFGIPSEEEKDAFTRVLLGKKKKKIKINSKRKS